jgi:hypothetical protein
VTGNLVSVVATHLDRCALWRDEPLFSAIDQAGTAFETATMGRAVLIAHLHPEDSEPGTETALIKQAVTEDVAATDRGDPTDTWTVTDQDGNELGTRVGRHARHRLSVRRADARSTRRSPQGRIPAASPRPQ